MKFNRFHLTNLFIFSSLLATSAYASQIYVEPTTGTGVNQAELTSATDLIHASIPEVNSNTVVEQPDKADFILRPKLIHLGEAYILSIQKVHKGQVVYASQLKASKIEELDKVAQKLTHSVLQGEQNKENPRVGEITNEEAHDGTLRRPTRNATYVGFGVASFSNLGNSNLGYSLGLAYSWDLNIARIKLLAEGDFAGNAFFVSGGLGGNFFFTKTDFAPYIGADFGGGVSKSDGGGILNGQVIGGFIVGVGAGIELFRTSSINLDLGFRAAFMLNSNNIGMPIGYTLRLGLYF